MRTHAGSYRLAAVVAVVFCGLRGADALAQADGPPPAPAAAPVRWSLGDVIGDRARQPPADRAGRRRGARRRRAARAGRVGAGCPRWARPPAGAGPRRRRRRPATRTRSTATTVRGTVTQLLTDFGRTGAALARAGDLAAASAQGARSSRVEVVFAAEVAYFNVLRAVNLQAVRRETLRQREALQRQAQAFFDAGLKARIDVVRAEANLYQARADAASAEHEVRTARLILLNRMGVDGPADFELAGRPRRGRGGRARSRTGGARPTRSTRTSSRCAGSWRRPATAGSPRAAATTPSLTASGSLGWSGTDELPADRAWSVGAQLSVPVFNGYLTRQQTAEAEALVAAAEFALSDRRRQIRLQVEQADAGDPGRRRAARREREGARGVRREPAAGHRALRGRGRATSSR